MCLTNLTSMSVDYADFLCTNIICVPFVAKESLILVTQKVHFYDWHRVVKF